MSARGAILRRMFGSAFFMDAGFFLVVAAVPYKVLALGGGPVLLGIVPAISSLSYIALTLGTGRFSDRHGRYRIMRYGNLGFILFATLAFQAPTMGRFMLVMPLLGLGAALYWPVIQASIGDLSATREKLESNLGRFNVAWSLGKSLGYMAGGLLLAHNDFRSTFLAGIGLSALSFFALPREDNLPDAIKDAHRRDPAAEDGDGETSSEEEAELATWQKAAAAEEEIPQSKRRAFRRMAWTANLAAFGAGGVLNHQLPKWFQDHDWSESRFGVFLGAVFFSQTLLLVLLAGRLRFTYSVGRLLVPQLLAGLVLVAIPFIPAFAGLLLLTPVLGASFGVCYAASIFYSLHSDGGKGRNAGIHESLIGVGIFLMPLLGGLAARWTGWLGAPYLLVGVVTLAGVMLQALWWREESAALA